MKNMFTEDNHADQVITEPAIQTAGYESTQKAGSGSTQTAGNGSTQTAGDGSTQTAGLNSVQIIRWFKNGKWTVSTRVITEKEANKPYKFENGVWNLIKTEPKVQKDCCKDKVVEIDGKKYKLTAI